MDPTIKSVGGIGGKYVRRKVAELASDPANVRKHNEKNLDAIKASLTRFGQQKPIVIDKSGVVRAGNGTLAAAKALGWAEIDCVETELEGAEATAYAIADNRTAELAEWDEAALTAVLQSLEHEDAALLEAAGFDQRDLDKLMAQNAGEVIEDEAPEPPAVPVTQTGDLWLLGKDDDVYDPFLGSGTTLIAAEQLGRKCYGLEIDPGYCDVIVARWEKLTGKKAQRVPA